MSRVSSVVVVVDMCWGTRTGLAVVAEGRAGLVWCEVLVQSSAHSLTYMSVDAGSSCRP